MIVLCLNLFVKIHKLKVLKKLFIRTSKLQLGEWATTIS